MTLISAILVGSILGFLRYNLSSNQKIFMGDCGSMLAGFLLAYQGISLIVLNSSVVSLDLASNAPVLLIAILSYPLFDLLRVFAIRIKQGRSPFSADSNHIHHRLLRIGLDHKEATLILCILNLIVISCSFLFNGLEIHLHLLITVSIGSLIYLAPFLKVFEKQTNSKEEQPSKISVSSNLQNDVIPEPVINLDSVVYSKTSSIDDSIHGEQDKELNERNQKEVLQSNFSSIVSNRRQNLRRSKENLTSKIPDSKQNILDGDS